MQGTKTTRYVFRTVRNLTSFAAGVLICTLLGSAATLTVDLTAGGSVQLSNGAVLVSNSNVTTVGTGVIDSFLRVQANGTEQGFNTDANVNNLTCPSFNGTTACDDKAGNFTHSVLTSDFGQITNPLIGGVTYTGTYVRFLLDVNENRGGSNELITLDQVSLYNGTSASPTSLAAAGTNTFNLSSAASCTAGQTSLCSTSAAGSGINVNLNYSLNSGSGNGNDMFLYVPTSALGTISPSRYLTLYSAFGLPYDADAGFEEWARITSDVSPVPEPVYLWLLVISAGLVFGRDYRRKRNGTA